MLDLVPDLLLGGVEIQQQNDYCQGGEHCDYDRHSLGWRRGLSGAVMQRTGRA
jgi:hypothetical protein